MQKQKFNGCDLYPINLNHEEIKNPILVLADFFSDDWLPCQLDRLKEWRDFVLKEDYFRDLKGSPVGLLIFYKHTIRLIEAAWLLKQSGNRSKVKKQATSLSFEQQKWRDFPVNLNEAELLNPYIVIGDLFESFTLLNYREELYEWLEHGLSKSCAKEFIETGSFIAIYENLQKLFSAAWMIYQRNNSCPYLKHSDRMRLSSVDNWIQKEAGNTVKLYQLNNEISSTDIQELIAKVIAIIRHKVPSVQAVIYLGMASEYNDKIYLLVLTSNDEKQRAQNLASTIEDSCSGKANVMALVHHASSLFSDVETNNPFFNRALNCPVIYLSGDFVLPGSKPSASFIQHGSETVNWKRWYSQGEDFLSGADFHFKNGSYNAALFALHQCVECVLVALVRGVSGYHINNHNLSRLLNLTGMFTNAINTVLSLDDDQHKEYFEVLKLAYVNVRYKDNYEADANTVEQLYLMIRLLLPVAEQVYNKHQFNNSL
jgi:HEPN domain-containing protein